MAYTLITANRNYSSWSLRPWLLMRALGIAFDDRVEPFGVGLAGRHQLPHQRRWQDGLCYSKSLPLELLAGAHALQCRGSPL